MTFKHRPVNSTQLACIFALALAIISMPCAESFARGGRGGGGGGGGGRGGGGMSRGGGASRTSSYNRSPSMSRPSTPRQSPTTSRQSTSRQSTSRQPSATSRQPSGNRSGASSVNRGGASSANRSGATNRGAATGRTAQGARPSQGDLNNFLNMPSQSGNRASTGAGPRSSGGNAAVNDFFSHNPTSANHNAAATHRGATSNREAGSVANQRSENISNRTDTRSNARDSRGEKRDFASDNRQDRVSNRGDNQAVRVSNRGETRSSLAAGRGENRSQRQQQRSEHADNLRGALENEFDSNHLFDDFWKNNPQAYYRFNQNPAFWTWATAATVGSFFGGGYASSGGGGGGEYYYDDGTVSTGEEQIPVEEYAAQAETIVESAPEVENPDDMEWLPLGVFALAEDNDSNAAPNMFLQLAVSKEGIVAGTYNNKSTDDVKSVEGMVDMKSGRAAWTIAGTSTPIMETTLDGLTANETNALIHFADGTTQQCLMLHLEKPAEGN